MTDRDADGYRRDAVGGPRLRTDVVDVNIVRRVGGADPNEVDTLQLLRARDPLAGSWQPVMGHVEPGERAWETALRELGEEVGLSIADPAFVGLWALEGTWPFYVADIDCVVASPRFVAEVTPGWEPTLNDEHDGARWIRWPFHGGQPADRFYMWPGQRHAIEEVIETILPESSLARERLRIRTDPPPAS